MLKPFEYQLLPLSLVFVSLLGSFLWLAVVKYLFFKYLEIHNYAYMLPEIQDDAKSTNITSYTFLYLRGIELAIVLFINKLLSLHYQIINKG